MKKTKKAQVWVETVIYTLIGLTIIGVILAVATPAIDKYKDEILLEQTISALNKVNDEISETKETVGNSRIVEFRIKKGNVLVDAQNEKIIYTLEESRLEYSQPEKIVEQGDININTSKRGKKYDISLALAYSDDNIDLIYNDENENKVFNPAPIPYKWYIENNGTFEGKIQINIKEL